MLSCAQTQSSCSLVPLIVRNSQKTGKLLHQMPVGFAPEPNWCSKFIQDSSSQRPQDPASLKLIWCLQLSSPHPRQDPVSTDLLMRGENPHSLLLPTAPAAFTMCPHTLRFLHHYEQPGCQKKIQGSKKTVRAHHYFRYFSNMERKTGFIPCSAAGLLL